MTTKSPEASTTTAASAPDLAHHALAAWLATVPPDPDLDRLAGELSEAWAAVEAERERGVALRRRRVALSATLATAIGADRTKLLHELLIVDADTATTPATIGEATRRDALARLAWFARLLALAEAEAAALVRATDGPLTAAARARVAVDKAAGYFGDVQQSPEKVAELRAEAARLGAAVAPDTERYRRAKEAAGMVRARVGFLFGDGVARFDENPYGAATRSWTAVATVAGEGAAERARRETTG